MTAALDRERRLLVAARNGQTKNVECLLEEGVNVYATDDLGKTALMYASEHEHLEIVKLLVKNGGEELVMAKDNDGMTGILHAALNGNFKIVEYLEQRLSPQDDSIYATALPA
eukprot:CAMPEP_0173415902 /NCGR_PEP_ID=MMETSP1356-20130122/85111_1 /TAXON_ID=77927 ORGANISM="Hemiselmis virescens, Strain PCC157" /NCGR_SAMPLE_ID=MMETSP1356 /ASSEMBLY_ACC=CAM_ASM_000847 /LENGTH=112 /DNA_ID=CAMNT_0014378187 /DNA_START=33 /DNA_END=371 /DNA_ORIENTATION=-